MKARKIYPTWNFWGAQIVFAYDPFTENISVYVNIAVCQRSDFDVVGKVIFPYHIVV
jgi:hypothetical protein